MFGMGTGITSPLWSLAFNTMQNEVRKSDFSEHAGRILKIAKQVRNDGCFMNGNDDMAKSHDLLVMLG